MKKFVLAQPGGFSNSLEENLTSIKRAGYDGVFFTLAYPGVSDALIEYTRNIGLEIETIHLPYADNLINNLWCEDKAYQHSLDVLKESIDFAYRNHVDTVILHTANGYHPPEVNEFGLNNYKELARYCRDRNIILAIENNKSFIHLQYLLEGLKDFDNVKLCFDIGHANAFTKNLEPKVWDELLNKLHCVHIHDNDGKRDSHLIPLLGSIDFQFWIPFLLNKKRDLNLTLEIYYMDRIEFYGDITPDDFYLKSMTNIAKILESIGLYNED